jgi:hypothetical protein
MITLMAARRGHDTVLATTVAQRTQRPADRRRAVPHQTATRRPDMIIRTKRTPRRRARDHVNGPEDFINWDHGQLTLRLSSHADNPQLTQLAALDSTKPLARPILLAEVDGAIVAALSLSTGVGAADPFQRTLGLIELLRVRACQLALAGPNQRAA